MPTPVKKSITGLSTENLLFTLAHYDRWRILSILLKSPEPLPIKEIARRAGISPNSTSKHTAILYKAGLLHRGYGNLYRICPDYIVPGENTLNFGPIILKFDPA